MHLDPTISTLTLKYYTIITPWRGWMPSWAFWHIFFFLVVCVLPLAWYLLAVCYHSWACHRQWEHVGCILMMSPHHAHCMANCLALSGEACGIGTTTMCPFVALNKEMFPNAPSSKKFKNLTLIHGCWGGLHPQFKAPFYFAVYFI